MAVNFLKRNPNGASNSDKVRGCIAIGLTLLSWVLAYNATDAQWQGGFLVAGILYFVTSLAIVFKDV